MFIIFKHLFARLKLTALSFLGLPVAGFALEQPTTLMITPRLCVLASSEQSCAGSVKVRWQTARTINVCLFQAGNQTPLQCWQQTAQGEFTYQAKPNRTAHFYLADTDGAVLAEGSFQVLQQQNAIRKRRNPWSFY